MRKLFLLMATLALGSATASEAASITATSSGLTAISVNPGTSFVVAFTLNTGSRTTIRYSFEVEWDGGPVPLLTDGHGGTDDDQVSISVVDTTAPSIDTIRLDPGVLWPPNHKSVPVAADVMVSDVCDPAPSCRVVAVGSNQPENAPGDGDTEPDFAITGDLAVELRAESAGVRDTRVYTVTVSCTDVSGNVESAQAEVYVPHDRRRSRAAARSDL